MTQDYYGTKRVTAWPQNKDVDGETKEGYAVKYADGYVSWSPKETFEAAYKPITKMDFSGALQAMKEGYKVRLPEWSSKRYVEIFESVIINETNQCHFIYTPELGREDWSIFVG